jgi:hypothetical protein
MEQLKVPDEITWKNLSLSNNNNFYTEIDD